MKQIHTLIDFVKYPIITEKSTNLLEKNQYTFLVDKQITKPEIKKVLEFLFDVNVTKVSVQKLPLKSKRIGLNFGYKTQYKKAIIRLRKTEKINIFNL